MINAIWIYNMTVETGHFDVLRRSFSSVSDDQRIQAIIIAFCFGALLEALAGFGTPVAITSVMLIALGFRPLKAAVLALVANTAPVAFGALATPIVTLTTVTGLPQDDLGGMVGRQTPLLALFVPLVLVFIVDRKHGIRDTWPAAVVCGVAFAVVQFVAANYISVPLTDILASLLSARCGRPPAARLAARRDVRGGRGAGRGRRRHRHCRAHRCRRRHRQLRPGRRHRPAERRPAPSALRRAGRRRRSGRAGVPDCTTAARRSPGVRAVPDHHRRLRDRPAARHQAVDRQDQPVFAWPGLHLVGADGKPSTIPNFTFNWLAAGGTLLLIAGLITIPVLGISFGRAFGPTATRTSSCWTAIVTVMAVLALAYVMNASGQTATLGNWMAGSRRLVRRRSRRSSAGSASR